MINIWRGWIKSILSYFKIIMENFSFSELLLVFAGSNILSFLIAWALRKEKVNNLRKEITNLEKEILENNHHLLQEIQDNSALRKTITELMESQPDKIKNLQQFYSRQQYQ